MGRKKPECKCVPAERDFLQIADVFQQFRISAVRVCGKFLVLLVNEAVRQQEGVQTGGGGGVLSASGCGSG